MATAKDEGARMGGGLEANGTLKYFRVELVLWGSLKRLRGEKNTTCSGLSGWDCFCQTGMGKGHWVYRGGLGNATAEAVCKPGVYPFWPFYL